MNWPPLTGDALIEHFRLAALAAAVVAFGAGLCALFAWGVTTLHEHRLMVFERISAQQTERLRPWIFGSRE